MKSLPMKIKWSNQVYSRHANNESVVWCPRTGGCTVLWNAQTILDAMKCEWRSIVEIACAVAEKFCCDVVDVKKDVEAVVVELVSQRFVEVDGKDDSIE